MAGKWEGFSDDDIKFYLNNGSSITGNNIPLAGPEIKIKSKSQKVRREKHFTGPETAETLVKHDIPEAALLIKRPESDGSVPENVSCQYLSNGTTFQIPEEANCEILKVGANKDDVLDLNDQLSAEKLEEFHVRQKLLEERNRHRKQLLEKLLVDRKKQTTQEARRLQKIQDELHKLDLLLSDDVRILRDEIETASKDFGEAQKRFNKAEKEFLDAKQCLFGKMERKELLTRHLCTIIEQNEMRKAQKLSELMEKLSVSDVNETPVLSKPETTTPSTQTEEIKNEVPSTAAPLSADSDKQ